MRVYRDELSERFVSLTVATCEAHPDSLSHQALLEFGRTELLKMNSTERLITDLAATELFENMMLLNRKLAFATRLAGSAVLKQPSAWESGARTIQERLSADLITYLAQEGKHAIRSVAQLVALCSPEVPRSSNTCLIPNGLSSLLQLPDADFAARICRLFASMSDGDFERFYTALDHQTSGFAPIFRVLSPSDIVQLRDVELNGTIIGNRIASEAQLPTQLSSSSDAATREHDKLFGTLFALSHIRTMRMWGASVFGRIVRVGCQINQVGLNPTSMGFPDILKGVPLLDGTKASLPENITILIAFYRHQARIVEIERAYRYRPTTYNQSRQFAHLNFDPFVTPGPEYLPDIRNSYGFAASLHLMTQRSSQETRKLFKKLASSVRPDDKGAYRVETTSAFALPLTAIAQRSRDLNPPNLAQHVTFGDWRHCGSDEVVPDFRMIDNQRLPQVAQLSRYLTSHVERLDAERLGCAFQYLDGLNSFPLEAESLPIIRHMYDVSRARKQLVQKLMGGLYRAQYHKLNPLLHSMLRARSFDAQALLEVVPSDAQSAIQDAQTRREISIQKVLAMVPKHNAAVELALATRDSIKAQIPAIRSLIDSQVIDSVNPALSIHGGVLNDVYSPHLLGHFVNQGNSILLQHSDNPSSHNLAGLIMFGNNGTLPLGVHDFISGFCLDRDYVHTELVVTSQDRPPGTYKRLFRNMCARIALSGHRASLGFVHQTNRKHQDILSAAGHTLYPMATFQMSTMMRTADGRLQNVAGSENRYIPAWLQIVSEYE